MDLADQIARLAELHAGGNLTDAEFADAKRNLIARAGGGTPATSATDVLGRPMASVPPPAPVVRTEATVGPIGSSVAARIYAVLHGAAEGRTVEELSEDLGLPRGRVQETLLGFERQELVVRSVDGRHRVTEDAPAPGEIRERERIVAPALGGWGIMVFLFGVIAGAIGYFTLNDTDPARANQVMRWGLIWTGVWLLVSFLFSFA